MTFKREISKVTLKKNIEKQLKHYIKRIKIKRNKYLQHYIKLKKRKKRIKHNRNYTEIKTGLDRERKKFLFESANIFLILKIAAAIIPG